MNSSARLLLALLLLCAAGLALFFYLRDETPRPAVEPAANAPGADAGGDPDLLEAGPGEVGSSQPEPGVERQRLDRQPAASPAARQGVYGTVVDGAGLPVVGAEVYLARGNDEELLRIYRQKQKGVRFSPTAVAETDAQGQFRLGLVAWQEGQAHDLHVLHPGYHDHKLAGIRLQPESWQELDKIVMHVGARICGQVTTAQGLPLADIQVSARPAGGELQLVDLPGREQGWTATTDAVGRYELPRLDPGLRYTVTAVAPQFAQESVGEVGFADADLRQIDFQLVPGRAIAGQVLDTGGQPIPGAEIKLGALSRGSRFQTGMRVDQEGRFAAHNLKPGPYNIIATAPGYQRAEESPIQAGETEVPIILERQGAVQVTVLDDQGRPLRAYHAGVRPVFKGQQGFGHAVQQKSVRGAADGTALIEGIDPGEYAVEVFAEGFAKNISAPFVVTTSSSAPEEVTLRLNQGGRIVGRLVDAQGKGIAGATVRTRPDKFFDNPLVRMFNPPVTISQAKVESGPDGAFVVERLYPYEYQLHFTHAGFCARSHNGISVQVGQTSDMGTIQLFRGCVLSGVASHDGKAQGQIKVMLSAKAEPGKHVHFSAEAVSDHEGKFLLNKRLPPGRYEIMAGRLQLHALHRMLEMQRSKRELTVREGGERKRFDIDIPKLD